MFIKYDGKQYTCKCKPDEVMSYHGLPEDFPAPVTSEIVLCADDGFVMRTDNPADYLRQTFVEGVLILTNEPERVIVEPEVVVPEPTVWDELDAAYQEGVNSAYDQ